MSKPKIVTIIQARTTSTRLPGKVLLPIVGKPMLYRMYERVKNSSLVEQVVIATSTSEDDDPITELCSMAGMECFRGSLTDLLDRHYQAGKLNNADAIAKIPSDCPLIDYKIIDKIFSFYLENHEKYDYVSNLHPATYPDGNDVEIISMNALEKGWKEAKRSLEREHTTPYFWENKNIFRNANIAWESGLDYSSSHRWTIDYPEDFFFIKKVYDQLYPSNPKFGLEDILELLKRKPELMQINSKYAGKYWYENHLDELNNIEEYKQNINLSDKNEQ
ncbi:MAG: glycosyltransferase family protein [Melioribacteraceae bacterium]|nr:glycosyltransferase family protein [Melioribacteraceae bacterium]